MAVVKHEFMVPFFVLLLLGSMVPFSIPVAAEPPIKPVLVAGDELVPTSEPDWPGFWAKLRKYALWDLE